MLRKADGGFVPCTTHFILIKQFCLVPVETRVVGHGNGALAFKEQSLPNYEALESPPFICFHVLNLPHIPLFTTNEKASLSLGLIPKLLYIIDYIYIYIYSYVSLYLYGKPL